MRVEVTRGDFVESVHDVAACAVDAAGRVVYESGNVGAPIYLRSAAKPFIAAAIIAAGARERYALEQPEIAIIAASHIGQPFHVDAAASILRKIGLDESALQCGPQPERSASPMYNNCSGKHAGILALCKILGADTATYLEPSNPAQQAILGFCARLCDDDARTWTLGIDGCGIPVYATSLRQAALSFTRLASLQGVSDADAEALQIVRDAMVAFPEYVLGMGQLDTVLMQAAPGAIVAKGGAEGVHGIAAIDAGLGYASKVLDGAGRARGPSTVAALAHLGVLDDAQEAKLARFGRPIVYNRAGRMVGEIRAIV
jgi:L-asparaginase II